VLFRSAAEEVGLGVPKKIPHKDRPVYGYVYGDSGASQYGDIELVFKPHVRERTTITCGDSLGIMRSGKACGTPLTDPSLEGVDEHASYVHRKDAEGMSYVEAQIQGGAHLSEVASVVIHENALMHGRTTARIKAKLTAMGIPFTESHTR
jgi:hypothetical protein